MGSIQKTTPLPRSAHLSGILGVGITPPRPAPPDPQTPLYLHFALGFKMFSQLDLPDGSFESNLHAVRPNWILADHNRRRYCGSAHVEASEIC
jgi:hypothetical protein